MMTATANRTFDIQLNGWNITFQNNDICTAWRVDGACMMEAEGMIEDRENAEPGFPNVERFVADRTRIVSGAVKFGHALKGEQPWVSN